MLKSKRTSIFFAFSILLLLAVATTASSNPDFILRSSVISSGGGISTSPNFRLNSTIGQSTPIGVSSSLNYTVRMGYQPTILTNFPPRANAGFPQHVSLGDVVTLDASRSYDPDGDLLTFQWTLTKPDASDGTSELSDTTLVSPAFTVSMSGTYTATLTVSDGTYVSLPSTVLLSTDNVPPIANAGIDQSASLSDVITLDGTKSNDAEDDPLTYQWTLQKPDGSDGTAELSDATIVNPTFSVSAEGTYGAFLTVNDGALDSDPNTVIISTGNVAPIAKATFDQIVYVGKEMVLDASESFDPDETPITSYKWAFTHKPIDSLAVLLNPETVSATFTIDLPGTYVVSLFVSDGKLSSFPDFVNVTTVTHEQAFVTILNKAIIILQGLDPSTQLMSKGSGADTE